jgi:predicted RND superfamily exporter protein
VFRLPAIVIVVVALVAATALPDLELDFDPRALVLGDGEPMEAPLVVLFSAEDVLAEEAVEAQHVLLRRIERSPEVARVVGMTSIDWPRPTPVEVLGADIEAMVSLIESAPHGFPNGLYGISERTGGPLIPAPMVQGDSPTTDELERLRRGADALTPRLLSVDHKTALLAVYLNEDADPARLASMIEGWDDRASVTGLPLLERALAHAMGDDPIWVPLLAALANVLVLLWGFRSSRGVVVPLAAAGLSLTIFLGLRAWFGVPISLLGVVLPPLILTLCVSDAVHLIARYEALRRTHGQLESVLHARRDVWVACVATSLTTVLGFGSFAFARNHAMRQLAADAAVGVAVAVLVTLFWVPVMLPLFRAGRPQPKRVGGVARLAIRRPVPAVAAVLVFALGATALAAMVPVRSFLLDPLGDDAMVVAAQRIDDAHGGLRSMRVQVATEDALEVADQLRDRPEVRSVLLPTLDPILRAWSVFTDAPLPREPAAQARALGAAARASGLPVPGSRTSIE